MIHTSRASSFNVKSTSIIWGSAVRFRLLINLVRIRKYAWKYEISKNGSYQSTKLLFNQVFALRTGWDTAIAFACSWFSLWVLSNRIFFYYNHYTDLAIYPKFHLQLYCIIQFFCFGTQMQTTSLHTSLQGQCAYSFSKCRFESRLSCDPELRTSNKKTGSLATIPLKCSIFSYAFMCIPWFVMEMFPPH